MIWLCTTKPISNILSARQTWFGSVPQSQLLTFHLRQNHALAWFAKLIFNILCAAQTWFGLVGKNQLLIFHPQQKYDLDWCHKITLVTFRLWHNYKLPWYHKAIFFVSNIGWPPKVFGRTLIPPSRNLLSLYQELGPSRHFPLPTGAGSPEQLENNITSLYDVW